MSAADMCLCSPAAESSPLCSDDRARCLRETLMFLRAYHVRIARLDRRRNPRGAAERCPHPDAVAGLWSVMIKGRLLSPSVRYRLLEAKEAATADLLTLLRERGHGEFMEPPCDSTSVSFGRAAVIDAARWSRVVWRSRPA